MRFLFKLDHVVFSNWPAQIILAMVWVVVAVTPTTWATWWVLSGVVAYCLLMAKNFSKGPKAELDYLRRLYSKQGLFPFMKGLNYSLLLGPLSLILAALLSSMKK